MILIFLDEKIYVLTSLLRGWVLTPLDQFKICVYDN